MEKNNIVRIIGTYLSGRFSPETEEKVQKWIIKDKDTEEKEKASLEYWDQLEAKTDPDTKLALNRVNQKIGYKKMVPRPFYQKRMSIAAALIPLLIIAGSYLYYTSTKDKWVEISVAYGDKKHFLLPDSSEIWLNAGTAIKYPEKFSKAQRLVYLDGEAYFSVRKDAAKPFIVETSQLSVKVLGTQFNVQAYPDDNKIETTLCEGSVNVTDGELGVTLTPSQQAVYSKVTQALTTRKVDVRLYTAWKEGLFVFENKPLEEIMNTLSRWYNINVFYSNQAVKSYHFTGDLERYGDFRKTLNMIEKSTVIRFVINGNNIMVEEIPN